MKKQAFTSSQMFLPRRIAIVDTNQLYTVNIFVELATFFKERNKGRYEGFAVVSQQDTSKRLKACGVQNILLLERQKRRKLPKSQIYTSIRFFLNQCLATSDGQRKDHVFLMMDAIMDFIARDSELFDFIWEMLINMERENFTCILSVHQYLSLFSLFLTVPVPRSISGTPTEWRNYWVEGAFFPEGFLDPGTEKQYNTFTQEAIRYSEQFETDPKYARWIVKVLQDILPYDLLHLIVGYAIYSFAAIAMDRAFFHKMLRNGPITNLNFYACAMDLHQLTHKST